MCDFKGTCYHHGIEINPDPDADSPDKFYVVTGDGILADNLTAQDAEQYIRDTFSDLFPPATITVWSVVLVNTDWEVFQFVLPTLVDAQKVVLLEADAHRIQQSDWDRDVSEYDDAVIYLDDLGIGVKLMSHKVEIPLPG